MLLRLRRPSPAFVLALFAVGFSLGGLAVAAIPDRKGVIHACYAKRGGSVRVISGTRCRRNERRLAWNTKGRTGATGSPGRDGAALPDGAVTASKLGSVIVRRAQRPLGDSSSVSGDAPCAAGERLIGGGASTGLIGDDIRIGNSYPSDSAGASLDGRPPTAWYATAANGAGGQGATTLNIYALCLG